MLVIDRRNLDNAAFVGRVQRWLGVRPDEWAGSETDAALTARLEAGVEYSSGELAIDRSLRLPPEQYRPEQERKTLIVLHHTVGASLRSTFDWWRTTPERIGAAYLVERQGEIFEVFDPRSWAHHLGRGVPVSVDRRAIGIEICSEGGLTRGPDGDLHAFGVIADRTIYRGEVYDHGSLWRGFRHFAAYTRPAIESVVRLVDRLCDVHRIPRRTPADHLSFDTALFGFEGIVGHHHLRADKSDVHPGFPWAELVERCGLELVP